MLSKTIAVLSYGTEEQLKVDVFTKGPVGAIAKVSIQAKLPEEYSVEDCTWEVDHIGQSEATTLCDQQGEQGQVFVMVDAGSNDYGVDVVITGSDGVPHAFTGHTNYTIQATVEL